MLKPTDTVAIPATEIQNVRVWWWQEKDMKQMPHLAWMT